MWDKVGKSCIVLMLCALSGGCAFIDNVGPRATALNAESAESKSTTVLMNIMRAAHSEPLQFTDIVSYTAQNSANVQMSANLPIAVIPSTVSRTFSVSPAVQAAGSNTFQVANLNNQEFYYGLQTPVSMQAIALFLKAGYDPQILLPLLISDIEIHNTKKENGKEVLANVTQWHGGADTLDAYWAFSTVLKRLIQAGLSVDEKKKKTVYGPVLNDGDAKFLLGKALQSGKDETPDLEKIKKGNDRGKYRLRKTKSSYRICFDRLSILGKQPDSRVPLMTAPANKLNKDFSIDLTGKADARFTINIEPKYFCNPIKPPAGTSSAKEDDEGDEDEKSLGKLRFTTRSPQGVFQYLGEIVRTEQGIGSAPPTSLALRLRGGAGHFRLFSVNNPDGGQAFTSITFKGKQYYVSNDPSGNADGSTRVLQILQELLALQSSAKNFPVPNVISVLGQ